MQLFTLFWTSTLILWTFLGVIALLFFNKSSLQKRGYPEDYANFLRKDNIRRMLFIAIALPVIELIASFITIALIKSETIENQLLWIVLLTLLILIPIIILDHVKTKKKMKDLAMATKPEIVIDLKYKTIKLVFSPVWEIIAAILFVTYGLMVIKPFWMAYLHVLLPWFFFLSVKGNNYTTKSMMRDGYYWVFLFMMLNYALVIYYQIRCFIQCYNTLVLPELAIGYLISCFLVIKFFMYVSHFPEFRKQLTGY